jgi:hypothetical protein
MLANQAPAPHDDSPLGDSDYDTILTALMETARGQAFLQEHARRARSGDTVMLLTAIRRIEDLLSSRETEPGSDADVVQSTPSEPSPMESMAGDIAAIEESATVSAAVDSAEIEVETSAILTSDIAAVSTSQVIVSGGYHAQAGAAAIRMPDIDLADHDRADGVTVAETIRPAKAATLARDPFADIRALSDEEKIALFT